MKLNWYNKIHRFIKIAQFSQINNSAVKLFIIFHGKKAGVTPKDSQAEVQRKAKNLIANIRKQIVSGESYTVKQQNVDKYLGVICRAPQDQQTENICRSYRQNKNQAIIPFKINLNVSKISILIEWYNYLQPDTRITKKDGISASSGQINRAYDIDTQNQTLSNNPAFCYLMLYDVLKSSDNTKITKLPPHLDASKIMQVYQTIDKLKIKQDQSGKVPFQYKQVNVDGQVVKMNDSINIGRLYAQAVAGRLVSNKIQQQDTKDGWVVLLGEPKVGPQQFEHNVLRSTRFGKTGRWCLSGKAMSQNRLRHKDLYFFIKDQDPKICINVSHNGSIYQIQGRGNHDTDLIAYLPEMQQFIKNHPQINFKNTKIDKMIQQRKKIKQQALSGIANVADVVNMLSDGQYNVKMNPAIQEYVCKRMKIDTDFFSKLPFDRFKFLRTSKIVLQTMRQIYITRMNDFKFDFAQYKIYGIDFSSLLHDPQAVQRAQYIILETARRQQHFTFHSFERLQNIATNFPKLKEKMQQNQQLIETITKYVLRNPVGTYSQKVNEFFDNGEIIHNIRQNQQNLNILINKIAEYMNSQNIQSINSIFETYGQDLKQNQAYKAMTVKVGISYLRHASYYNFDVLCTIANVKYLKDDPNMIEFGRLKAEQALNAKDINVHQFDCHNIFYDRKFDNMITQPIKQKIILQAIGYKIRGDRYNVSTCLHVLKMDETLFKSEFVRKYVIQRCANLLVKDDSVGLHTKRIFFETIKKDFQIQAQKQVFVNQQAKDCILQNIEKYVNLSLTNSYGQSYKLFDYIEDKIFQFTRIQLPVMKTPQVLSAIQRFKEKRNLFNQSQKKQKQQVNASIKNWYKRIK